MNVIPKMLTPKRSLVRMKTEQVDKESLLKHIDLSGIQNWSKKDKEGAKSLRSLLACFQEMT